MQRTIFSKCHSVLPVLIVSLAMTLATYWTFLVPIFQAADEDFHSDYVFTLYTKGRLIKGSQAPIAAISHPYITYLLQATNASAIQWKSFVKVSADYGTVQYFRNLDKHAPDIASCNQAKSNPVMMAVYPVGYYALTAIWLRLISHWTNSLTVLFFAARLFSVVLLGWALTMSYLTMKELKLPDWQSLLILSSIAFFPMLTFIAASIQPDNLSFALLSSCFFFNLRWLNQSEKKYLWAIALTLGLLLLTKYQFFACAAIATIGMIIGNQIMHRTSFQNICKLLTTLLLPTFISGMVQFYISWHCQLPHIDKNAWHWFPINTTARQAYADGMSSSISHICAACHYILESTYTTDGQIFKSFWGWFGWLDTPLIIYSIPINDLIRAVIKSATLVIALLTLSSIVKVTTIIYRLVKTNHVRWAIYLIFKNPVLNTYFLFFIFMWLFSIDNYPHFAPQGRHWYPVLLPLILTASIFSAKVFHRKIDRQIVFILVAGSWFLYSILGSFYALGCLTTRYYVSKTPPVIDLKSLTPGMNTAQYSVHVFDYIDPEPTFHYHQSPLRDIPKESNYLYLDGWAIDSISEKPLAAVLIFIDEKEPLPATYGLESLDALEKLKNDAYRYTGYAALIPTKDLQAGEHTLTIKFVSSDKRVLYPSDRKITFNIQKE